MTRTFVVPRTRPWLSAAERRSRSPNGTVEHRCTVITLARPAENVARIVARSAARRTTGAPRYDGYTSVAPASSSSRASRASPWPSSVAIAAGQAVRDERVAQPGTARTRPRPSLVIAA